MKKICITLCIVAVIMCGCMPIIEPLGSTPGVTPTPGNSENPTNPIALAGVRVYGISEAPYMAGSVQFEATNQATYVYRFYPDTMPTFDAGDSAEGFQPMPQDGILQSDTCRRLVIASVNANNAIERYTAYNYIPGVRYFETTSEPYTALLNTLTNTDKSDFSYGYGEISIDYLGATANGVNAGINYYCHENEPLYSPAAGEVIAVGGAPYNNINIYIPSLHCTLIILHCGDVSPAAQLVSTTISSGELLGYTGNAATPTGFPEVHLELLSGRRTDYAGYASDLATVRMATLDPLVLFDGKAAVTSPEKPAYVPYSVNAGGNPGLGLASRENGYIYYLNASDGNRIYRMKNDGTEKEKITSDKAKFVNVCEGWLYYSASSANLNFYKCRIDGSDRTKVYGTSMQCFNIVGDTIYLTTVTRRQRLSVVGTDGSGYQLLSPEKTMSVFYYKGVVYTSTLHDNKHMYTTVQSVAENGEVQYSYDRLGSATATNLIAAADALFFSNYDDNGSLYKVDLNGENPEKLTEAGVASINVYKDRLYFVNTTDYSKIYSCNLDGSELDVVSNETYCDDLCVAGDWLFFTTQKANSSTYCYNLITGETSRVD